MATIDQLTTSILDMSQDEAFAFVMKVRQLRRIKPDDWRKTKKSAKGTRSADSKIKGKAPKQLDLGLLTKTMSQDQKLQLLKELGVDV